jgi:hypothetical protein
MRDVEQIASERRFLLERVFQFVNFGIVTMGLGLAALGSSEIAGIRSIVAFVLCTLFAGATVLCLFSWRAYKTIQAAEAALTPNDGFHSPSYWYLFAGGFFFGLLSTLMFGYVGLS